MMDESLCKRCAKCCELKRAEGGFLRLVGLDCKFLIRQDGVGTCSIYNERLNVMIVGFGNVCVSIEDALKFGDLPPECPYALGTPGYKTKVLDWMEV